MAGDFDTGEPIALDVTRVSQELKIRPEVYVRLVTSFANSLTGKMKRLDEAVTLNNTDQARMILHEIKGTAGNLRLTNLIGPEAAMHIAVKAGEGQKTIHQHFETLKRETEKLQQYLSRLSSS